MAMPSARAPFQASLSASNGLLRERQLEIAAQCEATLLERFPAMLSNADVVRCMREVLSFRDQESGPIPAHAFYVIVPALIAYDVVDDGLAVAEHMSTYDLARYVPRAQNPDALMAFVARLDADLRQKDAELYAVTSVVALFVLQFLDVTRGRSSSERPTSDRGRRSPRAGIRYDGFPWSAPWR